MRIAFCHYYSLSFGGGGERLLVDAARWLTERGHIVTIHVVPIRRGSWRPNLASLLYEEAPFHVFSADVTYYMYNPLVWRLFRQEGPKIAGIHSPLLTQGLAEPGYTSQSFPQDVRRHGFLAAMMKSSVRFLQPRELLHFDAVDWVSPLEPIGIHHRRIYKNPGMVDMRVFRPRPTKSDEFTVLFVGRQDYGKGFDRYVELSRVMTKYRFVSTGESIGRIEGVGHPSDVALSNLYSESTVLLSPTRGDTFGRVLLEGLACGTPVITTSIPAHTALDLPFTYADSIEATASVLNAMFEMWKNDREEYNRQANAGVAAVRKYDAINVLPKFEAMLKQVATTDENPRAQLVR